MKSDEKKRLVLFGGTFSLSLVAAICSLFSPEGKVRYLFEHLSIPLLSVSVLLWIFFLVRAATSEKGVRDSFGVLFNLRLLGFSVLFVILLLLVIPPAVRILNDEVNLFLVSRSIAESASPLMPVEGYFSHGKLQPYKEEIPTRGLLFSLLTSYLHPFFGPHIVSAFALNTLCLFLLIYGTTFAFSKRHGEAFGIMAAFLLMSNEALIHAAQSGIFDVLDLDLALLSFLLVSMLLNTEQPRFQRALWITLILLANVRYESAIFAMVIVLLLVAYRKFDFSDLLRSPIYCLTPLLCLPLLWQRQLTGVVSVWAQRLHGKEPVLSVGHLFNNSWDLISSLITRHNSLTFCWPVVAIGMALCVIELVKMFPRFSEALRRQKTGVIIASACLVKLVSVLAFVTGTPSEYQAGRYFLIPVVTLILWTFLKIIKLRSISTQPSYLLCSSLLVFLIFFHAAKNDLRWKQYMFSTHYNAVRQFVRNSPRRALFVTSQPKQLLSLGYGAISPASLKKHPAILRRISKTHATEKVFFIRQVYMKHGKVRRATDPMDELPKSPVSVIKRRGAVTFSEVPREVWARK